MTDQAPSPCAVCKTVNVSRFQLSKYDRHGKLHGPVTLCSLRCLAQYLYDYTVQRGLDAALTATSIVENLKKMFLKGSDK